MVSFGVSVCCSISMYFGVLRRANNDLNFHRNLADTDRDGKMNINEFSIACKLVNLKIRGFEVPKQLPPTMIASLTAVGSTPILTPTGAGSMSPVASIPPGKLNASRISVSIKRT